MKSAQKPWTGRKSVRLYFWADVPVMFINPLPPSKATRLPMKKRLPSIFPKYLLPCSREKLTIFIALCLSPDRPPWQACEIAARSRLLRHRPRVQPPADGRQDELAPADFVGHRRSAQVAAGIHVPQH